MDTFVEQIVVKRKDGRDIAIMAGVTLGMMAILFISMTILLWYVGMLAMLVVFGAGFLAWRILTSLNKEFEYSVTNGDIDVDVIIARRKRKRLVSVSGGKLEVLEPYAAAAYTARPFDRTVMAAPSQRDEGLWCFTYRSKKSGHTLVIFQPERRVLEAMKPGLSALVQREFNKKYAAATAELDVLDAPE